jgi:ATP-binding cassette, subfamily B, multidrug efflux pump
MNVKKCILKYFKNHKLILLLTLLTIILSTLIVLVPPQILRIIVDDYIPNKLIDQLLLISLMYTLMYIMVYIISYLEKVLLILISNGLSKELRIEMMLKIQRMSFKVLSRIDNSRLEANITNDVDEINSLIVEGVISLTIDLIKIIGILVSIYVYSLYFGIIVTLVLPVIILFTLFIKKRMFKSQKDNKSSEASVNKLVKENLDNIKTIKSFRIYNKIISKYNDVLNTYYKTSTKSSNYDSFYSPVINILKYSMIVLLIILSSQFNYIFALSCGVVVSMIDLISSLFSPIETLGMSIQTIQKSLASISRINDFFLLEEDNKEELISNIDLSDIEIKYDHVYYSYDDNNMVINDFNYVLNNNDKLTLIGRSGCGKSTLFRLTYGLIKPLKGRVLINNIDAYYLSNDIKSKVFSIVYQDTFFTGGSIKDELTLLDNSIKDENIYEVLNKVGLSRIDNINIKFVESDYSSGELQLFNIVRAILTNSKIILLDEFNSKIDLINANNIIDIINNVSKDKIVLSITHYGKNLDNSKILNLETMKG